MLSKEGETSANTANLTLKIWDWGLQTQWSLNKETQWNSNIFIQK